MSADGDDPLALLFSRRSASTLGLGTPVKLDAPDPRPPLDLVAVTMVI